MTGPAVFLCTSGTLFFYFSIFSLEPHFFCASAAADSRIKNSELSKLE